MPYELKDIQLCSVKVTNFEEKTFYFYCFKRSEEVEVYLLFNPGDGSEDQAVLSGDTVEYTYAAGIYRATLGLYDNDTNELLYEDSQIVCAESELDYDEAVILEASEPDSVYSTIYAAGKPPVRFKRLVFRAAGLKERYTWNCLVDTLSKTVSSLSWFVDSIPNEVVKTQYDMYACGESVFPLYIVTAKIASKLQTLKGMGR